MTEDMQKHSRTLETFTVHVTVERYTGTRLMLSQDLGELHLEGGDAKIVSSFPGGLRFNISRGGEALTFNVKEIIEACAQRMGWEPAPNEE